MIATTRAMYMSSGAEWITLPNTTWSTCSRLDAGALERGLRRERPELGGRLALEAPPYDPTAVRAADVITTSVTAILLSNG